MIENAALKTIWQTASDISTVVEFYASSAAPTNSGFDPNNAIARYAAISGVTFMGVEYTRLVTKFGSVRRSMGKESNTASVTFSNVNRVISRFEFNTGFEGLIMVIRSLSRSLSDSLAKSQILFTGRCEKPTSGNKEELTVTASWVLGGPEIKLPRRRFQETDPEGRVSSDPEFEGFQFMPESGTVSYPRVVKAGGLWGLIGRHKTVWETKHYSSHSDIDANKFVPLVLGRAQILLVHIAYADVGTELRMRSAACEGPISDIQNLRAIGTRLALIGDWSFAPGLVGAANAISGETHPWPGNPSPYVTYYSRTAQVISHASNSAVETDEPAPDLAAVIYGMLMTIPNGSGSWVTTGAWSNDAAAHVRFLVTNADIFNLSASWLEDADFTSTWNYDREMIVKQTASDFTFLQEG